MKAKNVLFVSAFFLASPLVAQDAGVITMDQGPHHHLDLLASDQTEVRMVRVLPYQSTNLVMDELPEEPAQLVVALDPATISSTSLKKSAKKLEPGDFAWLDSGQGSTRKFRNGAGNGRFIQIRFLRAP